MKVFFECTCLCERGNGTWKQDLGIPSFSLHLSLCCWCHSRSCSRQGCCGILVSCCYVCDNFLGYLPSTGSSACCSFAHSWHQQVGSPPAAATHWPCACLHHLLSSSCHHFSGHLCWGLIDMVIGSFGHHANESPCQDYIPWLTTLRFPCTWSVLIKGLHQQDTVRTEYSSHSAISTVSK